MMEEWEQKGGMGTKGRNGNKREEYDDYGGIGS